MPLTADDLLEHRRRRAIACLFWHCPPWVFDAAPVADQDVDDLMEALAHAPEHRWAIDYVDGEGVRQAQAELEAKRNAAINRNFFETVKANALAQAEKERRKRESGGR